MAIIKAKVSGNAHVKQGGKASRKGGFGGRQGGGGGKGAAKGGGGGGQWMFIPAGRQAWGGAPAPQRSFGNGGQRFGKGGRAPWAPVQSFGKGGRGPIVASGKGRFGGGKGKGGGKGNGGGKGASQNPQQKKSLDKLGKIDAENKVWIGGLPKDTKRGAVYAHFKETCKPHMFELMSKGTACVAFKTPEDAQLAIDTFNGSDLNGSDIQVDVWTQKEKTERPEKKQKQRSVIKTSFLKGKKDQKGNKPGNSPMRIKIKAVDHSLKIWVGGLKESTTWKQLKTHFVDNGCELDLCDLMKPGTACVTFKTEDEATNAVGTMNGSELDDQTLTVDVWTRPERKEKKKKDEE